MAFNKVKSRKIEKVLTREKVTDINLDFIKQRRSTRQEKKILEDKILGPTAKVKELYR